MRIPASNFKLLEVRIQTPPGRSEISLDVIAPSLALLIHSLEALFPPGCPNDCLRAPAPFFLLVNSQGY